MTVPQKPCGFRQLCAIAKDLLERSPVLLEDQVEWKELIKERATVIGYPRPPTAIVYRAMNAIEHVHRKGPKAIDSS